MRIAALAEPNAAAVYRMAYPLAAMAARGHQVTLPDPAGNARVEDLLASDVVLIHRRCDDDTRRLVRRLKDRRIGVLWDNDDDFRHLPSLRQHRRNLGGRSNKAVFLETVRAAELADAVVVTTPPLKAAYEQAGIGRIEVIDNHLPPKVKRSPRRHEGLVVGWVAALEHAQDARALGLPATLRALLEAHPDVRVVSIGVDLRVDERYEHVPKLPFPDLPGAMAVFDIGIAPLVDTPFNRARSSIKVKEYAASRVPWLASPYGPYADLGEEQGGVLVGDDEWYDALDRLIRDGRARKRLAKAGRRWAKSQTIDVVADRYERLFAEAMERAATGPARATA